MNKKLFNTLAVATTIAGLVVAAGSASAATLSYTANTGGFAPTDISNQTLGVQKFNSSLGTLTKVIVEFTGDLRGEAMFENLTARTRSATVELTGEVNLEQSNLTPIPLFSINPITVGTYQLTAYDGTTDFGGTSGKTLPGLTATLSDSKIFNDIASLQVFTGTGNLNFLFSAFANSVVAGSGNFVSGITTDAQGSINVTYEYDPISVPEPSAILGFGLIAGFGLLSQGKKSFLKFSKS